MVDREKNIKRFEELMAIVDREGVDKLMTFVREQSDYFTAPASTRFHLSWCLKESATSP